MKTTVLERAATVAIIVAATGVAVSMGLQLANVLRTDSAGAAPEAGSEREPERVSESVWQELLAGGVLIGEANTPITVVEFVDLECRFCRRSHQALESAREAYGGDLAYVFIHFPIDGHRFAVPAARAAECAYQQERFAELIDVLFAKQDSFGLKPWRSYGEEAGVPDLEAFDECASSSQRPARIDHGLGLGERLAVNATPTVYINRWRLPVAPHQAFVDVIEDVMASRTPCDGR